MESSETAPSGVQRVCYVSRSRATPAELDALREVSQRRNAERGLSGALLLTGGHFLQWLEGPSAALARTLVAIEMDHRHQGMRVLLEGPAAARRFAGWAMDWIEAPAADDLLHGLMTEPLIPPLRTERLMGLLFGQRRPQA